MMCRKPTFKLVAVWFISLRMKQKIFTEFHECAVQLQNFTTHAKKSRAPDENISGNMWFVATFHTQQ